MKYRIKIITYKSGRKEYLAQIKKFFTWFNLDNGGSIYTIKIVFDSRGEALKAIDSHFEGNNTKQSIEFEYINK